MEFGSVGFCRGRKTLGAGRKPKTNSTHIWHQHRKSNTGHIGWKRVLSPLRHPRGYSLSTGSHVGYKEETKIELGLGERKTSRPRSAHFARQFFSSLMLYFGSLFPGYVGSVQWHSFQWSNHPTGQDSSAAWSHFPQLQVRTIPDCIITSITILKVPLNSFELSGQNGYKDSRFDLYNSTTTLHEPTLLKGKTSTVISSEANLEHTETNNVLILQTKKCELQPPCMFVSFSKS